jgi:hypothetical protein
MYELKASLFYSTFCLPSQMLSELTFRKNLFLLHLLLLTSSSIFSYSSLLFQFFSPYFFSIHTVLGNQSDFAHFVVKDLQILSLNFSQILCAIVAVAIAVTAGTEEAKARALALIGVLPQLT